MSVVLTPEETETFHKLMSYLAPLPDEVWSEARQAVMQAYYDTRPKGVPANDATALKPSPNRGKRPR